MAKPLTLREVIHELESLAETRPEALEWPVHVLDMGTRGGEDDPDEKLGGLVTHVEVDRFSDEQGWVVDLTAWHSYGEHKAG